MNEVDELYEAYMADVGYENLAKKRTNEELNKKLAEWAGILLNAAIDFGIPYNGDVYEPPNFTESLDACDRWLVPKLTRIPYLFSITLNNIRDGWNCMLIDLSNNPFIEKRIEAEGRTLALFLCLAIEKLIDSEKSK